MNKIKYYVLKNNKIWNIEKACYTEYYDNNYAVALVNSSGKSDEEYLKTTLLFYGYKIGNELLTLEEVKENKLKELEVKFQEAEEIGTISSSLGFSFTANNRALRDIESLIKEMEYTGKESDYIVAADNNMYELSASQLKTLFIELTQYGKQLYNTKWALRSKISKATTKEEVDAVQIVFVVNYTPTSVILRN